MKKVNWVLVCVTLSLFMGVCLLVTTVAQTQDVSKPALSSEQMETIKETINSSKDVIKLDPDNKGSFDWWGYIGYPTSWNFYYLICGQGSLEIHLTDIPEGSDFDLYLFDCNGAELAFSNNGGNSDEQILLSVLTDTYWIGVYRWSGGGSYHLRVSKNTLNVIARSDFSDEAISNSLICIEARLLRFARNDCD